jgi:ectoine hydroxylase-related dioxygenase (phytanoyl-CoA dioxygenase family)
MKYTNYNSVLDDLNTYLDSNGVAVIPNILNNDECISFRNEIWDEIKYVSKNRFDINNLDTWNEFYNFNPFQSMLLHHYSLGHMQPIWNIRQHPNVIQVFEKIWNIDSSELLVSFDGLSIHLPPEKTNRGFYNNNGDNWFHTDQSSNKIGKHCIQGLINLYPVNDGDATLSIIEKSHLKHESFFIDNSIKNKSDWYQLKDNDIDYFKNNNQYAIKADIGSIILWDSRTFHQGIGSNKNREKENFRMVIYITMLPRSTIKDPKILIKKQKAFQNLKITSHWANNVYTFPKKPQNCLADFNIIRKPILNNIGLKLAGF